eukprot:4111193-Karenia_brevis.AAC.1
MSDCGGVAWSHPRTPTSSQTQCPVPSLSPLSGRSPRACQGGIGAVELLDDDVVCHADGFGGGG